MSMIEIDALPQERGDRFVAPPADTLIRWTADRCRDHADGGEPDILLEADQIKPGDADGDRAGGPA
ncbi:hypothetical protein [Streptosporangium sp. CA-115845]|uniref:hypothetical protein n=1 Tax=Streptosporangium sp. CA-115845 TaxID=3240071 RepID=UPI003D8A5619